MPRNYEIIVEIKLKYLKQILIINGINNLNSVNIWIKSLKFFWIIYDETTIYDIEANRFT